MYGSEFNLKTDVSHLAIGSTFDPGAEDVVKAVPRVEGMATDYQVARAIEALRGLKFMAVREEDVEQLVDDLVAQGRLKVEGMTHPTLFTPAQRLLALPA